MARTDFDRRAAELRRRCYGRTNEEMAELLDVSPEVIRHWRRGRNKVRDSAWKLLQQIPIIEEMTPEERQARRRYWAERILRAAEALGTQRALADRLGVGPSAIRGFMHDGRIPPKHLQDAIIRIASQWLPADQLVKHSPGPKGPCYHAKPSWDGRISPVLVRFWRRWRLERADAYRRIRQMRSEILEELEETVKLCRLRRELIG